MRILVAIGLAATGLMIAAADPPKGAKPRPGGFEPEAGRFTSFSTNSRQTRMSVRQSRGPFGRYPDGSERLMMELIMTRKPGR